MCWCEIRETIGSGMTWHGCADEDSAMTTSALPSELNDDAHSHSGRHQLHKEHSGDLEAHFLHVGHPGLPRPQLPLVRWQARA